VTSDRKAFFRKPPPPETPIGPDSCVLVRVGTACDQTCIMCPNPTGSGRSYLPTPEWIRRVDFVASLGFPRVMLTGGEPTLHPGFEAGIEVLATRRIAWDIVTNGGMFSTAGWAERARAAGLRRAVVSLHSHDPVVNSAITNSSAGSHRDRLHAIHRLQEAGLEVMVNHVLLPQNREGLCDFIQFCAREFGPTVRIKVAFPLFDLPWREWSAVHETYADCMDVLRAARAEATTLGMDLLYEGIPNCILGDPHAASAGRIAFGVTHYLEDDPGDRVLSVAVIESEVYVFAEFCNRCLAFERCTGVHVRYAERYGMPEMIPFGASRWF